MKLKDFFKPHSVSCSKAKDIFEEGLGYEKAGNMEEAYSCYKIAADAGMPEAMFRLFVLFAVKGFHAKEENNLFELAFQGTPVMPWSIKTQISPDIKTGMYWLSRAAETGHIQACGTYGRILCDAGDLESGLTYLHKASDAGDCDASRWIAYFTKAMKNRRFTITQEDYLLANRRAARQEEIDAHGKQLIFRTHLQKSKKVYDRNALKRAAIKSDDGSHCIYF